MEELERCLALLAPGDAQARARAALSTVRQELDMHKDAAASRQKTGQEWQTIAGNKEMEVVRLRAEVNRMRQAMSSNTQLEQQNAQRLQRAEADAIAVRQQLEAAMATITELQGKLGQARSEADTARSQLSGTQFSEKALKARIKELEGQASRAQREQQQQQQKQQAQPATAPAAAAAAPPPPPPPQPPAPGVDMEMLAMMEGQLARLSDIIRTREAELGQMRSALQAGLEERRELLQQIEDLGTALQMAQQQGGGGGGEGSGLGSPKSSVGAPARGLPHVSPGRPYRTGLQSKPRHFK
ncbi:hypothetical protein TSOC_004324 [Tetrabaena socialis]|uniref:Uncharacterized protein n=1 Tax=Tetrabaena socialis TaxID=47790 RepID=A0A2J8A964_9CHLO|nr:hypothetical protein TSOC_004324 [Tetrabaena socialis]|eukprot:PNH09072.1 hypothetical protein TSOC_004324 [Tetrabaena socialis]